MPAEAPGGPQTVSLQRTRRSLPARSLTALQPSPGLPGYRKGRECSEPRRLPGILEVQVNGWNRHPDLRVTRAA